MKTAISIPDKIFEKGERTAKKLGISRSELYATAVHDLVERYQREDITEQLNRLYSKDDSAARLEGVYVSLQTHSIERDDW